MQETGVVTHLQHKRTPEQTGCEADEITSAIHLEQAQTAFYMLAAGMGLALLSFIMEVLCSDSLSELRKRKESLD